MLRELFEALEKLESSLKTLCESLYVSGNLKPEHVDMFVLGFITAHDQDFMKYFTPYYILKEKGFEVKYQLPEGKFVLVVDVKFDSGKVSVDISIKK